MIAGKENISRKIQEGAKMRAEWGKYLGYSADPCPNCGRYRLERYENGKEVCEKCGWCPQDGKYVDRERMYAEEDYHGST